MPVPGLVDLGPRLSRVVHVARGVCLCVRVCVRVCGRARACVSRLAGSQVQAPPPRYPAPAAQYTHARYIVFADA